jgi:hypothetical protein
MAPPDLKSLIDNGAASLRLLVENSIILNDYGDLLSLMPVLQKRPAFKNIHFDLVMLEQIETFSDDIELDDEEMVEHRQRMKTVLSEHSVVLGLFETLRTTDSQPLYIVSLIQSPKDSDWRLDWSPANRNIDTDYVPYHDSPDEIVDYWSFNDIDLNNKSNINAKIILISLTDSLGPSEWSILNWQEVPERYLED